MERKEFDVLASAVSKGHGPKYDSKYFDAAFAIINGEQVKCTQSARVAERVLATRELLTTLNGDMEQLIRAYAAHNGRATDATIEATVDHVAMGTGVYEACKKHSVNSMSIYKLKRRVLAFKALYDDWRVVVYNQGLSDKETSQVTSKTKDTAPTPQFDDSQPPRKVK